MALPGRGIAQAQGFIAPPGQRRHRPETTLLYQLVAEHYPGFRDRRAAEEISPGQVRIVSRERSPPAAEVSGMDPL